jgi:hypothetical protein
VRVHLKIDESVFAKIPPRKTPVVWERQANCGLLPCNKRFAETFALPFLPGAALLTRDAGIF